MGIVLSVILIVGILFISRVSFGSLTSQMKWMALLMAVPLVFLIGYKGLLIGLILASIVTRGLLNVFGPITIFDGLFALLSLYLLFSGRLQRTGGPMSRELKVFWALMGVILLSQIAGLIRYPLGTYYNVSLKSAIQMIEFFFIMWFIIQTVQTEEDVRWLVQSEVACGLFFAVVTFYELNFGVFTFGVQPIFGNTLSGAPGLAVNLKSFKLGPNSIPLLISATWLMLLTFRSRFWTYAVLPFVLLVFSQTSSRTMFLAFTAGMVGLLFLRGITRKLGVLVISIVILAFTVEIVAPQVSEITNSIQSYINSPQTADDSSTFGRLVLLEIAPQLWLRHPFLGYGINGFGLELFSNPEFIRSARVPLGEWLQGIGGPAGRVHNQYMQVLVDHGIIAFLLFIYLLFLVFRRAHRNFKEAPTPYLRQVSQALLVSYVSVLAALMAVGLPSYGGNNLLQLFFYYNLGLIMAIHRIATRTAQEKVAVSLQKRSPTAHLPAAPRVRQWRRHPLSGQKASLLTERPGTPSFLDAGLPGLF